jgi:1-acyl-sn-glycerol-3-phosphate acyltransferase
MNDANDIARLAPYRDGTFREAIGRVLQHPLLPKILAAYFPQVPMEKIVEVAGRVHNADQFQKAFIDPLIDTVLQKTSRGLTFSGAESLEAGQTYLFVSTHRDILLDPSLFAWALFRHGVRTPMICLGDNLLSDSWIADLMKINKGVTVIRGASQRELLRWSIALSELLGGAVRAGTESVWIAEAEGRAKDGDNVCQAGVIKMLALAGEGHFLDRLASLRLRPVAISYEFEPCDALIAREQYLLERDGRYSKAEGEDMRSVQREVAGTKGGIHIAVGPPLQADIERARTLENRNLQARAVCQAIDREIHASFRLWPSHYIAYDRLQGEARMQAHYDDEHRVAFEDRMTAAIGALGMGPADRPGLERHFLKLYAKPVENRLATTERRG